MRFVGSRPHLRGSAAWFARGGFISPRRACPNTFNKPRSWSATSSRIPTSFARSDKTAVPRLCSLFTATSRYRPVARSELDQPRRGNRYCSTALPTLPWHDGRRCRPLEVRVQPNCGKPRRHGPGHCGAPRRPAGRARRVNGALPPSRCAPGPRIPTIPARRSDGTAPFRWVRPVSAAPIHASALIAIANTKRSSVGCICSSSAMTSLCAWRWESCRWMTEPNSRGRSNAPASGCRAGRRGAGSRGWRSPR